MLHDRMRERRCWSIVIGFLAITVFSGTVVGQSELRTGYGRCRGLQYATSINGTAMLKHFLESQNCDVVVNRTLSPAIENFDLLIWAPDSWDVPSESVIERINLWLRSGQNRTLVYIGRDYDASMEYWQNVINTVTGEPRELALRELSQSRLNWLAQSGESLQQLDCEWFTIEPGVSGNSQARLIGEVTDDLFVRGEVVWGERRIIPKSQSPFRIRSLIETETSEVFAFELTSRDSFANRIIVVNNGSFLLNYPFARKSRRPLAEELLAKVSQTEYYGCRVMLLESGPQGLIVSDSENVGGQLAWVVEAPLKYIVPQIVILGVMYCFVVFPILGRPRRLVTQTESRFGRHLEALGRMWAKTGRIQEPREVIDRFRRSIDSK